MGVEVVDIARILGGAKALNRDVSVYADLREAVEAGLPVEAARKAMSTVVAAGNKD